MTAFEDYRESTTDFLVILEHFANGDDEVEEQDVIDAGDEWFEAGREVGVSVWP